MTTIAYRDGVIAADSQVTWGTVTVASLVKIARGPDGSLAGASGDAGYNAKFLAWVSGGREGDAPEPQVDKEGRTDFGFIILADGRIEQHEAPGVCCVNAPFLACGSGRELALGAMAMGASAEEAVAAAIRFDVYSGGEITVLKREA